MHLCSECGSNCAMPDMRMAIDRDTGDKYVFCCARCAETFGGELSWAGSH
jgi:hypothetical protein